MIIAVIDTDPKDTLTYWIFSSCRKVPVVVDLKLPKDAKLHICGDIHGQFYDLLKIFKAKGEKNVYLPRFPER